MKVSDIRLVTDGTGLRGTSILWRVAMTVTCTGLILYIVGFSTDWWCSLKYEDEQVKVDGHSGLWRKCVTVYVKDLVLKRGCEDMDNDDSFKPASKALCSIGLILGIIGLPVVILAGCTQNPSITSLGGMITIAGGIVSVIGSAVYVGKAKDKYDNLEAEYSTFLAIAGALFLVAGGGFQLLSIRAGYQTLA